MKRFFDILISLIALFVCFPIFITVIFLIKIESNGPIFYRQKRLGRYGSEFELYKFRSMVSKERDHSIQTIGNEPDITKIGLLIRRLKIDELPQMINVLKGDMSIVGPRPCLPDLKLSFNDDAKFRLEVRPGLTGLAQVNGNIHLSWEERWAFDREYVESKSLLLDIKIIAKTILIVLFGDKWGLNR